MVLTDCDQQQGPGAQMESRSPPALRVPLDRSSALAQAYGVFQLKGQGTAGTTGPLRVASPPALRRRRAGLCMCRLRAGLGGGGEPRAGGSPAPPLLRMALLSWRSPLLGISSGDVCPRLSPRLAHSRQAINISSVTGGRTLQGAFLSLRVRGADPPLSGTDSFK